MLSGSEMIRMEIESIKIGDIKPYENNPRQNDKAVEAVKASIREFGFKVPLVIDKNNVIVCGHTRYKALKQLKWDKVPCIRADDLTDDQIKAFRIADNKVSELAEWDMERLQVEIDDISLDMSSFGIEIGDIDPVETEDDDSGWYGDERERTNRAYNLNIVDHNNLTDDFWQMPIVKKTDCIPADLIGFNYAKTCKDKDCGIHFFVDDYQFERVWNYPEKYVDILAEYDCILTPDFSLYFGGRGSDSGGWDAPEEDSPAIPITDYKSLISERETKPKEVDQVLTTLKTMTAEYGVQVEDVDVVTFGKGGGNIMGVCTEGGNLGINKNYFYEGRMNGAWDRCAAKGYHPSRGDKSGLEATAAHEYGHAIMRNVTGGFGRKSDRA